VSSPGTKAEQRRGKAEAGRKNRRAGPGEEGGAPVSVARPGFRPALNSEAPSVLGVSLGHSCCCRAKEVPWFHQIAQFLYS